MKTFRFIFWNYQYAMIAFYVNAFSIKDAIKQVDKMLPNDHYYHSSVEVLSDES